MTRVALFLSSYTPLFLILAVRFADIRLALLCLGFALLGVALAIWVLRAHEQSSRGSYSTDDAEDLGQQTTTYLVTYLLPFVSSDVPGLSELIGYSIFLLVAGLIYVRSDMLQVNPIFYLTGRRIVKVTTGAGRKAYVITRRRVLPEPLAAVELTPGILLEVEPKP